MFNIHLEEDCRATDEVLIIYLRIIQDLSFQNTESVAQTIIYT